MRHSSIERMLRIAVRWALRYINRSQVLTIVMDEIDASDPETITPPV